jgi:hypothetical protein
MPRGLAANFCYCQAKIWAVAPEHVAEKLIGFSYKNMLQAIDYKCILIDRTMPSDRNTLLAAKLFLRPQLVTVAGSIFTPGPMVEESATR